MLMAVIRISKTWNVSNLDAVDKCVEIAWRALDRLMRNLDRNHRISQNKPRMCRQKKNLDHVQISRAHITPSEEQTNMN